MQPSDPSENPEEVAAAGSTMLESQTSHRDDQLNEKLKSAFHKETFQVVLQDIAKIASEYSAIDLAYAASRLPGNERPVLYKNLPSLQDKTEFIINTDSNTRVAVFRHIDDLEAKQLIESMPPDEAVAALDDMSERRVRRLLDLLDIKKAKRIKELKQHQRNTAGRLMTNEFFSFTMQTTVGAAADFIHDNPGIDLTQCVFVVNELSELQGYIPARNLIVNPPHLPLRQVMRPIVHKVSPDSSREEVVDIVERYKISALPVVDAENHLLGVITYEDVLEAIEDIADETIANMAGTAENISEHDPIYKRFFARAPWLIVTLLAGLINVGVISSFQRYEAGLLTFVLFFIPLITGMSGNIGIQCSTVLVRSIATGVLSAGTRYEAMLKEMIIGLCIGCVFGVLCGICVYFLDFGTLTHAVVTPVALGLIVGIGLLGACLTGTLLGVFSPIFFARLGIDPAIASGPIVTAFNDFLSMSIYFLIAIGLSSLLT